MTPTPTPPAPTPAPSPTTAAVTAGAAANTFTPAEAVVGPGGIVTWTFGARVHNVVFAGTGAPAAVPNTQNAAVARTFPTAGTFAYTCTLHAGMNGTVVVR